MLTAQELYSEQVRSLSTSEQLRLASLILQGVTASAATAVDYYSDEWSEEDMRDLAAFSMRYAAESSGEE
jgi:hypothetical protein